MNKNMLKPIRYPVNVVRVAKAFVEHPQGAITIKELLHTRGLRIRTSEKRTREAVDYLVKRKILKKIRPWGVPSKGKKIDPRYNIKFMFELSKTAYAFKQVLSLYPKADFDKLLASDYVNIVIEDIGFEPIHEIIEPYLSLPGFKQMASSSLLNHRATREEYTDLAKELQTRILESSSLVPNNDVLDQEPIEISSVLIDLGKELSSIPIKPIEILSGFDPLPAVRFYRDVLHKSLLAAYDELAERNIITRGLCDFLAFDNYLSPLTAHPLNNLVEILFSTPFERIYEDAYLLDGDAFWVFSGRAAAIYSSFADFLFEYFRIDPPEPEEMEVISREMVYSWNIASTRFDIICHYLSELYENGNGSRNYHLKSDGFSYDIIDLESGKSLLPSNTSSSLLLFGSIPRIFNQDKQNEGNLNVEVMKEPYSYLRPCLMFEDMGFRSELIPIEEILYKLKEKLST